jgi:hypothetical protein
MPRALRFIASVASAFRGAWLVVGASLALLLLLEIGYRTQAAVKKSLRRSQAVTARPDHPYVGLPWFPRYLRERADTESPTRALTWSPYVYWRRQPYGGQFINVDSAGLRVTPQPGPGSQLSRLVWFFGGSTMWGTFQRDSATIPAVAASRWAERGARDLDVVNRGEYGYVFTQEVLALELALRRGERPAVVVFLDGINDVASAWMNDRAGLPQNESNRVAEFRVGRLLSAEVQGTRDEPRALMTTAVLVLGRLAFVQRVLQSSPRRPASRPLADSTGAEVARAYAGAAEWVEALAARYGFVPFYVWQPQPLTTRKPVSAFERAATDQSDPMRTFAMAADTAVARAMARVAGPRFISLTGMFDDDSASVFLDFIGHTTEAAAARIAVAIADTVLTTLTRQPGRQRAP